MDAEKELIALDKKKQRLAVKIEKEQEPIANKLKSIIHQENGIQKNSGENLKNIC